MFQLQSRVSIEKSLGIKYSKRGGRPFHERHARRPHEMETKCERGWRFRCYYQHYEHKNTKFVYYLDNLPLPLKSYDILLHRIQFYAGIKKSRSASFT